MIALLIVLLCCVAGMSTMAYVVAQTTWAWPIKLGAMVGSILAMVGLFVLALDMLTQLYIP